MNLSAKINNIIRLNRGVGSDDGFQSGGKSRESHALGIFNAKRVSVLPLQNRSFNLRLLILSFFSICLLTVISCSNLAGAASSDNAGGGTPADSQIILCTGNISTGGGFSENVAGILSSAVAPTSSAASSSAAGAAGSDSGGLISAAAPTVQNTYTYFAEATAANADGTTSTATGSFNNETNPTEFGIALAAGKSWTITCGIKNAAGDIVLSDSYPDFTPTAANPVINYLFNLRYNSSGTGSISLVMTADPVISRVTASCRADAWQDANGAISYANFSGGSATLSVPSIAAGTYEVVLKFYSIDNPSGTGSLLRYMTEQSITVADGMVTSTWRSDGTGVINAEGVFNVSSSVINAARRYTFYVGSREGVTGSNGNEGYSSRPFATITQACKYIVANADSTANYTIFVDGTVTGSNTIPSTITSSNAQSVTISGRNGLNSSGVPQDFLNGGFTEAQASNGNVLRIEASSVPVTIKNLKITGGWVQDDYRGGGIYILSTATTLENCVVTGNKTSGTEGIGAGIVLANSTSSSLTLKGKNIIKDNFNSDGTKQSNLYLGRDKKINIAGDISGSQIGIYMPFITDGTGANAPAASAPVVFTENYGYGGRNTSLPGVIFTAENRYAITRIESGTNAGEAAFAVSSGGMYTAFDYDFSFTTSAVTAVVNTAKNVAVPVTVNRSEADGNETELSLADIADDIEWNAALYSGTVAVNSNLNVTNTSTGINIALPAAAIAYEGTYLLKITATYMGLAHDAEFTVSVNPPYTFSTEPAEIPAGTTGTAGTSATYVYFGDWPQTIKASDVEIDENTTKVQGAFTYYLGSDGNYYAKCLEEASETGYTYSDGTTVAQSSANSYKYFKVEPVKWRVLTDDYNGTGKKLLLAENVLACCQFYNSTYDHGSSINITVNANNYEHSRIRAYLNGINYDINGNSDYYVDKGFLQAAFTSSGQSLLANMTVSVDGNEISDNNVFALSKEEACEPAYGFDNAGYSIRNTTDYAKAVGTPQGLEEGHGACWWLRSPSEDSSGQAYYVTETGGALRRTVHNVIGIVPAIVLEN